ncbi:uncharacterized protein KRP23_4459 [Phytophthora ramorum]|uniref:uncharacterized protein n=1 Tax=Phytophthora ramorum TaxID=164328 RepID=UPI00309AAEC1|nr:hypothetical protein KRP23_4459 [Phytophthora ramorum]
MDQKLLRPRAASQSPLLPRHEKVVAPPAARRRWRLWLLRLLLLAGALYVALLVCWSASRLGSSHKVDNLVASVSEPEVGPTSDPSSSGTNAPPELLQPPPVGQVSAREVSIRAALAVARAQEAELKAKMTPTDKREKKKSPPAVAGKVVDGSFCGMTMVQHDAQGEVLFLHRNSHKLTGLPKREEANVRAQAFAKAREKLAAEKAKNGYGRMTPKWSEVEAEIAAMEPAQTLEAPEADGYPDEIIWTHLLSFNSTAQRADYVIEAYNADPQFPKDQHCYGQRHLGSNPNFYAQEIAGLSFAELETHLRRFAQEAAQQATQDARS